MNTPLTISAFDLVLADTLTQLSYSVPSRFSTDLVELLSDRHDIAPGMTATPHFGAQRHAFVDRWHHEVPTLALLLARLEDLVEMMDRDTFRVAIAHIRQITAPPVLVP